MSLNITFEATAWCKCGVHRRVTISDSNSARGQFRKYGWKLIGPPHDQQMACSICVAAAGGVECQSVLSS